MADPLKILIFDESVVQRHLLSEIVSGLQDVEVVAVAATGKITLAKLSQIKVDLILFDVGLTLDNPIEIMKKIGNGFPDVGMVTLSAQDSASADLAIQTLEMGALDLLTKPDPAAGAAGRAEFKNQLEPILRAFRGKKHVRLAKRLTEGVTPRSGTAARPPEPAASQPAPRKTAVPARTTPPARVEDPWKKFEVVGVGVSTGGPNALAELIPLLPGDLGVPVLLVQHMPPTFTAALAASLDRKSALRVREGGEGMEILPNTVYIAPGGKHMVLQTGSAGPRIELNTDPPVNSCRPAVDVLFESIAKVYKGPILAVIMTGMGNDGVEGVRRMKKGRGCYCLTQTEDTCVVYGMPRAVDEAGLSDEKAPLGQLAARIEALIKKAAGNPGR
ncbi:MAG: chemotaxis-specific protein-glutamate methyltransferase CheB [Pseudomonadota bacterium]